MLYRGIQENTRDSGYILFPKMLVEAVGIKRCILPNTDCCYFTFYNKCGVIKMNQSVLYEPCDFINICKINSERDYVLLPIASFIPSKHFINPSFVEKSDAISNLSHRSAFSASKRLIKLFSSLLIFKSIVAEIITFIEMFWHECVNGVFKS